jgi:NAD(P)H-hydrate epimerase
MQNIPDLWLKQFPFPKIEQHKYNRGHVVVSGGPVDSTGATCLAAISALRVGAGLVTVASPESALIVYAVKLTAVMAKPFQNLSDFKELISDQRKNIILLGPGNGINDSTLKKVKIALTLGKHCVIDADAITVFKDGNLELFKLIKSPVVMTPHEGEFRALFGLDSNRNDMAKEAARVSGAVIVLKGHETIIAAPDGRISINNNAPPTLATAGSGDVLSGIIAGLMAQGMEVFQAACCGVWLHGKAAQLAGVGMISEDLPNMLPKAIQSIYNPKG